MGAALWHGPQAAGLWGLIATHRSALEYDWRTRFGFGLSRFLSREMSWREAWVLTSEILRDPDSHTAAAIAGWAFVPGSVQRVGTDVFEAYINANRGKNTTPFRAQRPWTKASPKAAGRVSDEDREQRARLDRLLYGGGPLTD